MANGNGNAHDADVSSQLDDELRDLFSAFDAVSASDELKDATLARILGSDEQDEGPVAPAASASDELKDATLARILGSDEQDEGPAEKPVATTAPGAAHDTGIPQPEAPAMRAVAGGKSAKATRRTRWRAIRVAAVAACLAFALTGTVAYAVPSSYYEVAQDDTTITLGVNCFGITVSATSDTDAGEEVIESAEWRNIPREESLSHVIDAMEQRLPDEPVEFGPQGGERETIPPRGQQAAQEPQDSRELQDSQEPQEPQEPEEPQKPQEPQESQESQAPQAPEDARQPQDPQAPEDPQDPQAPENPQDPQDGETRSERAAAQP